MYYSFIMKIILNFFTFILIQQAVGSVEQEIMDIAKRNDFIFLSPHQLTALHP